GVLPSFPTRRSSDLVDQDRRAGPIRRQPWRRAWRDVLDLESARAGHVFIEHYPVRMPPVAVGGIAGPLRCVVEIRVERRGKGHNPLVRLEDYIGRIERSRPYIGIDFRSPELACRLRLQGARRSANLRPKYGLCTI